MDGKRLYNLIFIIAISKLCPISTMYQQLVNQLQNNNDKFTSEQNNILIKKIASLMTTLYL